jgi:hypothetical protein
LAELVPKEMPMPGKRVQFDEETWNALDLLARDRMQDFQELADEAFSDLLRKHGRPTDLKTALRQSAGTAEKSAVINPDFQKPRHRCDVGPSIASRRGRGILQRNEASEVGKQELPRN